MWVGLPQSGRLAVECDTASRAMGEVRAGAPGLSLEVQLDPAETA